MGLAPAGIESVNGETKFGVLSRFVCLFFIRDYFPKQLLLFREVALARGVLRNGELRNVPGHH
jgi:hypothetical protein